MEVVIVEGEGVVLGVNLECPVVTNGDINIESLLTSSDRTLFRNMQKCEHCPNHLLPPRKDNLFALRPAGHEFILPTCNYQLHRRSFVVRCLFNFLTA